MVDFTDANLKGVDFTDVACDECEFTMEQLERAIGIRDSRTQHLDEYRDQEAS